MRSSCRFFINDLSECPHFHSRVIFKLADLMDAIIFIFQEGVGEHAKSVRKNLESIFKKKVAEGKKIRPEYNWKVAETILHDLLHAKTNQLEFEYE
jgi:5'-deoxynucleotidase